MNELNLRNDVCTPCQSGEDRHGRRNPLLSRFRLVMGCDTFSPSTIHHWQMLSTRPRYLLTEAAFDFHCQSQLEKKPFFFPLLNEVRNYFALSMRITLGRQRICALAKGSSLLPCVMATALLSAAMSP